MASKTNLIIGMLLLTIMLSGIVYISMDNVQIKIDKTSSSFYVKDDYNITYQLVGKEYNKLYNKTTLVKANSSLTKIVTEINNLTKTVKINRFTYYPNNVSILDTYYFDGTVSDISKFPIYHTIEIKNAKGLIYQYEVTNLPYNNTKILYDLDSPLSFAKNMRIEFDEPYYSSLGKTGVLKLKYKINSSDSVYNIKLFDPISGVTLNSPIDNYNSTTVNTNFSCTIESSGSDLKNVSLYTNETGSWAQKETINISGTSVTYVFNTTDIVDPSAPITILWNCLGADTSDNMLWATANYSLNIDTRIVTWQDIDIWDKYFQMDTSADNTDLQGISTDLVDYFQTNYGSASYTFDGTTNLTITAESGSIFTVTPDPSWYGCENITINSTIGFSSAISNTFKVCAYNESGIIIDTAYFNGDDTTNLTSASSTYNQPTSGAYYIRNLSEFKLENNNVLISTTNVNLTGPKVYNSSSFDFSNQSISINSTYVPDFENRTTQITFYNYTSSDTPVIYYTDDFINFSNYDIFNGAVCSQSVCTGPSVDDANNRTLFNVTGFSSFITFAGTSLKIWDSTDSNIRFGDNIVHQNDNITFYTEYMTGSTFLTGATCRVSVKGNEYDMEYNSLNNVFLYTTSYSTSGDNYFTVRCNQSGYNPLSSSDTFHISSNLVSNAYITSSGLTKIFSDASLLGYCTIYNDTEINYGLDYKWFRNDTETIFFGTTNKDLYLNSSVTSDSYYLTTNLSGYKLIKMNDNLFVLTSLYTADVYGIGSYYVTTFYYNSTSNTLTKKSSIYIDGPVVSDEYYGIDSEMINSTLLYVYDNTNFNSLNHGIIVKMNYDGTGLQVIANSALVSTPSNRYATERDVIVLDETHYVNFVKYSTEGNSYLYVVAPNSLFTSVSYTATESLGTGLSSLGLAKVDGNFFLASHYNSSSTGNGTYVTLYNTTGTSFTKVDSEFIDYSSNSVSKLIKMTDNDYIFMHGNSTGNAVNGYHIYIPNNKDQLIVKNTFYIGNASYSRLDARRLNDNYIAFINNNGSAYSLDIGKFIDNYTSFQIVSNYTIDNPYIVFDQQNMYTSIAMLSTNLTLGVLKFGSDQDSTVLVNTMLANETTTGENWTFACKPEYQTNYINSSNLDIVDTISRISPKLRALDTDSILGYCNFSRGDLNTTIINYTVFKNNVALFSSNITNTTDNFTLGTEFLVYTLPSANTTIGDNYTFSCMPWSDNNFVNSSNVEISNPLSISGFSRNVTSELGSRMTVRRTGTSDTCLSITDRNYGYNYQCDDEPFEVNVTIDSMYKNNILNGSNSQLDIVFAAPSYTYLENATNWTVSAPYIYLQYNKTVNYYSALWEVKHGCNYNESLHYNISIPMSCFDKYSGYVYLRIKSLYNASTSYVYNKPESIFQCYDGNWIDLGVKSISHTGSNSIIGTSTTVNNILDANWSTKAYYLKYTGYAGWFDLSGYNCSYNDYASVYEEGLHFKTGSSSIFNLSFEVNDTVDTITLKTNGYNVSGSNAKNIKILVNDTYYSKIVSAENTDYKYITNFDTAESSMNNISRMNTSTVLGYIEIPKNAYVSNFSFDITPLPDKNFRFDKLSSVTTSGTVFSGTYYYSAGAWIHSVYDKYLKLLVSKDMYPYGGFRLEPTASNNMFRQFAISQGVQTFTYTSNSITSATSILTATNMSWPFAYNLYDYFSSDSALGIYNCSLTSSYACISYFTVNPTTIASGQIKDLASDTINLYVLDNNGKLFVYRHSDKKLIYNTTLHEIDPVEFPYTGTTASNMFVLNGKLYTYYTHLNSYSIPAYLYDIKIAIGSLDNIGYSNTSIYPMTTKFKVSGLESELRDYLNESRVENDMIKVPIYGIYDTDSALTLTNLNIEYSTDFENNIGLNSTHLNYFANSSDTQVNVTLISSTQGGLRVSTDVDYLGSNYTFNILLSELGYNKLSSPTNKPASSVNSIKWDNSSTYLALSTNGWDLPIIYKRTDSTLDNLTNTTTGSGYSYALDFDDTSTYLAYGKSVSPYIGMYKRSGDTFTTLTNVNSSDSEIGAMDFDSTSTYLATLKRNCASSSYNLITVYKRVGDNLTYLSNLSTACSTSYASSDTIKFSPDSNFLAFVNPSTKLIELYNRSSDTFTYKSSSSFITGSYPSISWDSSSTYIAVYSNPNIYILKRVGSELVTMTYMNIGETTLGSVIFHHTDNYLSLISRTGNLKLFYYDSVNNQLSFKTTLSLSSASYVRVLDVDQSDTYIVTSNTSGLYFVNLSNSNVVTNYSISNYYSDWTGNLPSNVDSIEFYPYKPIVANITPFGQTNSVPILNITAKGLITSLNLSMNINNTISCVNITASSSYLKSAGSLIVNNTWNEVLSNLSYGTNRGIWLWADLSCSYSTFYTWSPNYNFRSCAHNVDICSTELD